ncbi:MAG: DUF4328 domain-containing protein [Myxococcota bacterium]
MTNLAKGLGALLVGTGALEALRAVLAGLYVAGVLPETAGALGYGGLTVLGWAASLALFVGLAGFSYRAATNVRAWEPDFHQSPVGAAVGWFVPVWNLYKPYDALCSVWSGSAIALDADEPRGPTRIVEAFWATWALSILVGRLFGAGEALANPGDVAAAALSAVACGLGAVVVLRIGQLQDEVAYARTTANAGSSR